MYSETTDTITVTVQPFYLSDESEPEEARYVWAYRVRIENNGEETVQLLRRHWRITDGFGRTREVEGVGVVGEQPVIQPGETFEYTSRSPLATSSGLMAGSYRMSAADGRHFDIAIPLFSLDTPERDGRLN